MCEEHPAGSCVPAGPEAAAGGSLSRESRDLRPWGSPDSPAADPRGSERPLPRGARGSGSGARRRQLALNQSRAGSRLSPHRAPRPSSIPPQGVAQCPAVILLLCGDPVALARVPLAVPRPPTGSADISGMIGVHSPSDDHNSYWVSLTSRFDELMTSSGSGAAIRL